VRLWLGGAKSVITVIVPDVTFPSAVLVGPAPHADTTAATPRIDVHRRHNRFVTYGAPIGAIVIEGPSENPLEMTPSGWQTGGVIGAVLVIMIFLALMGVAVFSLIDTFLPRPPGGSFADRLKPYRPTTVADEAEQWLSER
jgi:hypothetical protein